MLEKMNCRIYIKMDDVSFQKRGDGTFLIIGRDYDGKGTTDVETVITLGKHAYEELADYIEEMKHK